MADRSHDRDPIHYHAVGLLALGAGLHYGWAIVPAEHAAYVWNASGAIARAALLVAVVYRTRAPFALAVAAWWLAEEAMVAGCNLLYVFRPWELTPGKAMCSSLLQLDIGKAGAAVVLILLVFATVRPDRVQDDAER